MALTKAQRTKKTTTLPAALLEQIGASSASRNSKNKHSGSRKDSRKAERAEKKQRKAQHFSTNTPNNNKRRAVNEHGESPQRKKAKLDVPEPTTSSKKPSEPPPIEKPESQKAEKKATKKLTALQKLAGDSKAKGPRSQQETQDDAYIDYLETKLGYGKKAKGKSKVGDGLDDLLDFADSLGDLTNQVYESEEDSMQEMSDVDDIGEEAEDDMSEDEEEDIDEEDEDADDNSQGEATDDEEEWGGIVESSDSESEPLNGDRSEPDGQSEVNEKAAEPTTQAPAGRYIPPHLRQQQNQSSDVDVKLVRQLKGLINRLSEQNLSSIIDGLEEAYRNHRRADVTSTLCTLIIDGIASHALLLDSFVVLHAAFVSSLHKIIGIEFAAYFVQNMINSYEKYLAQAKASASSPSQQDDQPGGKESSNLIVLLSELYNFQVVSCVLVFDIVRSLLEGDMNELNVELLLKLMRSSGNQLRQDDPSALKDIVQIVQTKLSGKESTMSSRTKFMVETLTNLKNNKVKQRPAAAHQGGDAVERMKKFLSNLGKRKHVVAHEPLRLSLHDLHSADTKGKWWLVGAAWGGDPLMDKREELGKSSKKSNVTSESKLMKLAKKHGMNTDIRRSIFVLIMSSDDYIDACERLSQLKLTEVQQREIIRVLLHCCGNEKTYNPYYTLIASHLCKHSHSYKITLQFALWDFLRDMGETSVGGSQVIKGQDGGPSFGFGAGAGITSSRSKNIAKTYAWLIAKDNLTLLILKPVDFTLLKAATRSFLDTFLTHIFVYTQTLTPTASLASASTHKKKDRKSIEEVFLKAARVESVAMGLVYFMGSEMGSGKTMADEESREFVKWSVGIAKDTLRTGIDVISHL